ncbi:syntenin-1-like [Dasypus novemcinctus]|uniref:syntenin-1-like n=1 Tax=Dasypus novemcinctus TaxID=9361 RepID=UPI00062A7A8A|nr:syntenin-1-like [Dasypus novemcinctus]
MSSYPTLEDLIVDKVIQAQAAFSANLANLAVLSEASAPISQDGSLYPKLYLELLQCMSLSLNEEGIVATYGHVQANSPACLVGLRFGDQVLQSNSENYARWSSEKAHPVLKQAFEEKVTLTIRDRPFERMIMHKDSTDPVSFIFKNGKITSIVKDSSAARNSPLTEHDICEVIGQNVIALKDSQIADLLSTSGAVVTITIMPAF